MSNIQLLQKLITFNGGNCLENPFENPLLEEKSSKAVSNSFLKVLKLCSQNTDVNSNMRLSVLENIRNLCRINPENHLQADENLTEILKRTYRKQAQSSDQSCAEIKLDAFLIQSHVELEINSNFPFIQNPEVTQALINLKEDSFYSNILQWEANEGKAQKVLKYLWTNTENFKNTNIINDVAIKLKYDIENTLLNECLKILKIEKDSLILDYVFSNNTLTDLSQKCSISHCAFHITCGVLNTVFILTGYNSKILKLIQVFIEQVKLNSKENTFLGLYQTNLRHIVVLLDIDVNTLPNNVRDTYVQSTVKYLNNLGRTSDLDLVMLMSHFPSWLDLFIKYNLNS